MITENLDVVRILCTQCGMCKAVWPEDAIELKRINKAVFIRGSIKINAQIVKYA